MSPSFAELLRHHRLAARLTQEALAERAGLSVNTIQKLESGSTQPYRDTARRLVEALQLAPDATPAFNAAAQPKPRSKLIVTSEGLPVALTRFVGREREVEEITRLLATSRLLTLSGVGGCGKTRLAIEVARRVSDGFPGGVWLVELATVADAALVPQAIASVLRIREIPTQPLVSTVVATLKRRRLLLVLDNCEHVLHACAQIADALLLACPQLQILTTSREQLGLVGEVNRRVRSLPVPPHETSLHADDVRKYAAVQLFVDRARAHSPDFDLTERTAMAIARVCQRLDGIPLALELAAPLVQVLSIDDIAARLDERFRLVIRGSRTAPLRQQTLSATIDWSYQLLSKAEQILFMRLSVFGGRWTLEAAEKVCAGEGIEAEHVLRLLLRLVDQSLVTAEKDEHGNHLFRLLETLREYARDRLHASGGLDAVHRKHASYYLTLAMRAEVELHQPRQAEWIGRLWTEETDLLAAVDWFVVQRDLQQALEIAGVLARVWQVRGQLIEGRRRLAQLLELPGAAPPTLARAKVLDGAGVLALYQGDMAASRLLLMESLALYRKHHHLRGIAWVLIHLGWLCHDHYRERSARRFLRRALEICRRIEDPPAEARCLNVLGMVEVCDGDVDLGRSLHQESLQLSREIGDHWGTAWALTNLGTDVITLAELGQTDAQTADPLLEEALTIWQELGERRHFAFAQHHLSITAALSGKMDRSAAMLDQSLSKFTELQDTVGIWNCVSASWFLLWAQGKHDSAVRMLGATYGPIRAKGQFYPLYASIREARMDAARALLGADRFDTAWTEGCAMSLESAIAHVRQDALARAIADEVPYSQDAEERLYL